MSRFARRTDLGHGAIVAALRQLGCAVLDLSRLGRNCPDLLVWRWDTAYLMEVKRPDRTGGDSGLSAGQRKLMAEWPGPCVTVWGLDDAIAWATGARRPPMPAWAQRQEARREI